MKWQARRGTAEQWETANPILEAGEFGVEIDTGRIKVGVFPEVRWDELPYATGPTGPEGPAGPAGPAGPTGPAGPPLQRFEYVQDTPAATWTIVHNLGTRPPLVLTLAADPTEPINTDVTYPDLDTAVVTWPTAETGWAYI